MEIDFDRDDIKKEILKNHRGDIELFFELADEGTDDWCSFKKVIIKMIKKLKEVEELTEDIICLITPDQKQRP